MAPDFTLEDTHGQPVRLADRKGRLVVLVFASQATQEASGKAASGMGKKLLQNPAVDIFTIVSVPKMFKLMAMGVLKGAQQKAVEGARKRFEKEGATAPADLEKRIVILPDWDGGVVKQYGFDSKAKSVHMALIGTDGAIVASFSEPDGEKLAEQASEKALTLLG